MKVRVFEHGLSLIEAAPGASARTPGLHASEIYGDLYKRLDPKRYDKRNKKGEPLPLPEDRVGFGLRFEEALEPQLAEKWRGCRPGEAVTQHEQDCRKHRQRVRVGDPPCVCGAGIIFSPDYLFDVDGESVLGEFKLTWYSSRGFPGDVRFDKWMTQIKFYLRNLHLNRVWIFPFWVNGGTDNVYHKCQPEFTRAWELVFEQAALERTHKQLVKHANKHGMITKYMEIPF